jgi:hypothetical protein
MGIELIFALLTPFALTLTVAMIRSRRRKPLEVIISTIQGAC